MGRAHDLALIWYGDASLVLRCKKTDIAFDPFDGLPVGSIRQPQKHLAHELAFRRAHAVFVTHGHFDHIYHIPRLYSGLETPIYCTTAPAATLRKQGIAPEQLHTIGPDWEGSVGPFTLHTWQGRHCRFDGKIIRRTVLRRGFFRHPGHLFRLLRLDRTYPEKGEILFYQVTCAGIRIQILGSMNLDRDTVYPTGADLLVLPLQGRSDQDTYALELVRRLEPKQVLLDHYDNAFPPMSDQIDVSGFVENVERNFGIPCRPLEIGKWVDLEVPAQNAGEQRKREQYFERAI